MVGDQPNKEELEELIKFCEGCKEIYIYGMDLPQKLIAKYLLMSKIKLSGFLVEEIKTDVKKEELPIVKINNIWNKINIKKKDVGVIMTLCDCEYNNAFRNCQSAGIKRIFFMTEHNKRTIPYKMTPRSRENFWLEVNLADHCNLNCQMCDHFSPIAEETFYDLDEFKHDMERLAELTEHNIGIMKLQGGEPLLNNNLLEYIRISREQFPNALTWIFTDGVLLLKWENHDSGNLWKACRDYNVEIQLTKYPINLDFEKIVKKAEEYGVALAGFSNVGDREYSGVKFSVRHPFDLSGKQKPFRFIDCYQFNESIVMAHGKIYTCPMIPYVKHFNKYFNQNLIVSEQDYIDIYKVNSFEEIAEFCTHRTEFCRYCATHLRTSHEWKQSTHDIKEWAL